MSPAIQLAGKDHALQLFGVPLVGITAENGKKLLLSVAFLLILVALNKLLRAAASAILGQRTGPAKFWVKQLIRLTTAVFLITGVISIWFNDPGRLGQAAAFVTAGLAIASQRVITSVSAYFILLRGKTFHVGDRIVMGGVRGDVIALGFIQTTIMEIGQSPPEQPDAPSAWVAGRQYTGRIVTVSNDKIFDTPVYNFTREFPYIWEEMRLPIPYTGDRKTAEKIILDAARKHTTRITELSEDALHELERRYVVKREELEPCVYFRLTDNWVELAVRFVAEDHGIRKLKDAMSREILDEFDRAKISIASGTYEVVGFPEVKVRLVNGA
jgi:small-conductance mechanosensitive channel